VRRIFIILGFFIFIPFFVSSNANAVTPTGSQNPPGSSTSTIPCDDPDAKLCLTTQPCSSQGCQAYECKENNGNYFCKNPPGSSACQGDKCLYSQPCVSQDCKIYKCGEIKFNILGAALVCIPPKSDKEITPEPTEPNPPSLPCAKGADQKGHCSFVETGLGINISTDPTGLVKSIFSLVLGVSGGIALLLIIYSGYKLMAARGEPEALQAARDQLISAIIGLIFIIFSLVILQIIGVDILRIPGLGK